MLNILFNILPVNDAGCREFDCVALLEVEVDNDATWLVTNDNGLLFARVVLGATTRLVFAAETSVATVVLGWDVTEDLVCAFEEDTAAGSEEDAAFVTSKAEGSLACASNNDWNFTNTIYYLNQRI